MSFRVRLIVVSAAAVAAAIALSSITVYVFVRAQLLQELDRSLRDRAAQAISGPTVGPAKRGAAPGACYVRLPQKAVEQFGGYFQVVDRKGAIIQAAPKGFELPVSQDERSVAIPGSNPVYTDGRIGGQQVRIYTSFVSPACALQVARPLTELSRTLRRLAVALSAVSLGGIGFAALLGWLVAGTALRPVRRLTEASEHVARTRDLSRRIHARGRDELARLATSFNTMLGALEQSLRAQRQLVADASHELRTPLTTVKTNVEVLQRTELPIEERRAILRDVSEQIDELTVLVSDIVDLARGVEPALEREEVRLDLLVAQTVERVRRHAPGIEFALALEPCVVVGVPSRLDRAVANLLDNACKWSPSGGKIEVRVADGEVSVRDHGPGIDDADLPFVFDRFYRAPSARSLPGSGLGLAIVRQVADSHSGRVAVEQPEDGGTLIRLSLAALAET
jgi:two-component system sensor histidine kinase MprB